MIGIYIDAQMQKPGIKVMMCRNTGKYVAFMNSARKGITIINKGKQKLSEHVTKENV